ncbi:MAG: rRNA maturation RNase YbeY [Ignavibacteriales bacterium]|nr:rRNA maturation RNase YbeY [Ignavibacteriales bacterium]
MIVIHVFNTHSKYRIRRSGTIRIVRHVLKCEYNSDANVNVVFIDKKRMIGMNGTYLNHWYSTDVICFPLGENPDILEGEIYINVDQARQQARLFNIIFKEECARLIIHGILHLVGYRDKTKKGKERMTKKEDDYLKYFLPKRNLVL